MDCKKCKLAKLISTTPIKYRCPLLSCMYQAKNEPKIYTQPIKEIKSGNMTTKSVDKPKTRTRKKPSKQPKSKSKAKR